MIIYYEELKKLIAKTKRLANTTTTIRKIKKKIQNI